MAIYTGIGGSVAGAAAFFDANKNRVLDFLDLNGDGIQDADEPAEVWTVTSADGLFALTIPEEFDANTNGVIDPEEGQIVVAGRVDASPRLPMTGPLTAPAGCFAVSALSTLMAILVDEYGFTAADAQERVRQAFDLPDVDLNRCNVVGETATGNVDAAAVLSVIAKLENALAQTASFVANAADAPPHPQVAQLAVADIAGKIIDPESDFDLSDPTLVESVILGASAASGLELGSAVVRGAASVIVATNEQIDAVALAAGVDFLTQVAQAQVVAQGVIAQQLGEVAAGRMDIDTVIQDNTGDALVEQITAASPGNVVVPQISISDARTLEGNSGTSVLEFTVTLSATPADPVSVEFITWDGSATVADGDYQPVSTGLLTWDAGDSTSRTIQVPIYGDTAFEPDESLLVLLKNPVGAAFWNDRGTGTIVNDDPFSYVVPSDGQPNDLVLSADGSYVSLTRHEELVFDGEFSQPLPITIAGPQDAAASLAVRWVSPSDVLSAGVQFQGGQTLGDSLLIDDSVAQTVRHTITGDGSGTFTVDGTLISYTDVESVGDYWAPTITGLPTAGAEGTEVQLQALLPDPERVEMSTLQWTVTKDEATIAEVLGAEFRFTPSDDGQYVVSVTATAEGAATATTTHTLTIHNLAPQLEAGADETLMPPVAGAFRRNGIVFSDPGADVWNGTVNFGDGSGAQALTIDQAAKTFDLAHTFTAEGSFTVTVTVCDDDGGAASDTFQVTVSLNTPPVAEAGGPYSVAEGRTILLDAFGSADRQQPSNTLIYEWDFDGDGEYDDATGIAPTFSAALLDGLTSVLIGLKVTDSYGEWRTDTATVTVVNAAPVATADSATTEEDAEVAVGVLANDSDAAGPADPLQIVGVSNGAHGMARIDDNGTSDTTNDRIVYTPDANFNGTDSFTYTIGDGDGGIATATVTVTVNPVNDTPTMASPIADVTVDEDVAAVIVDLAGVFGDVDIATNNDALTLSVSGNTNAALVTPTLNGTRLTSRRWSSAAVFPWPTFERSARGGVPATTTSM